MRNEEVIALCTSTYNFFQHVLRTLNTAADFLVNKALDTESSSIVILADYHKNNFESVIAFRGFSDGGVRGQSNWTCTGKAA